MMSLVEYEIKLKVSFFVPFFLWRKSETLQLFYEACQWLYSVVTFYAHIDYSIEAKQDLEWMLLLRSILWPDTELESRHRSREELKNLNSLKDHKSQSSPHLVVESSDYQFETQKGESGYKRQREGEAKQDWNEGQHRMVLAAQIMQRDHMSKDFLEKETKQFAN